MAGRGKLPPGAQKRDHRTTIRWTESEKKRLEKAQESLGVTYEVDVIRLLTLRQLELMGFPEE